jgi:hypothetical protein
MFKKKKKKKTLCSRMLKYHQDMIPFYFFESDDFHSFSLAQPSSYI